MYYGSYYHKVEAKGRVSVPAKFRDSLTEGSVITRGLDGSLYIYDFEHWQQKLEEAGHLGQTKKSHREYIRYLTNNAQEIEIDPLGRINISEELKQSVGIEKNVVFVGSLDHIEVWDQETYRTYMERVEKSIEDTVEVIDIER